MGMCSYEMKSARGFWELSGARELVKQRAFMFQATQEAEAEGSSENINVSHSSKNQRVLGFQSLHGQDGLADNLISDL